ncbi:MAG: hypothetical protein LUQ40_00965 [Methanomicrobiales archaeon]|nr:hypothetical protein [Methanomicrobiales archaeon]
MTIVLPVLLIVHGIAADPTDVRTAYLGEEILLQGVNTDSGVTYLFITGPNLPLAGGRLDDPHSAVIDGNPASFTRTEAGTDNHWQYHWETAGIGIDAGTYAVYAESFPRDRDHVDSVSSSVSTFVLVGPAGTPTVRTSMTSIPPITTITPGISSATPVPILSPPSPTTAPATNSFSAAISSVAILGAGFLVRGKRSF